LHTALNIGSTGYSLWERHVSHQLSLLNALLAMISLIACTPIQASVGNTSCEPSVTEQVVDELSLPASFSTFSVYTCLD
jgi:hypothetical protein